MNVYRENIMYNFRNQTYCDSCAAIAFCKGNSFMLATMIEMRVLLEIIYMLTAHLLLCYFFDHMLINTNMKQITN